MSDALVIDTPASPVTKATKEAPKVKKIKKPSTHPTYNIMIAQAINALKEKTGSSRQAIVKYIVANFKVEEKAANTQVKLALKRGVESGSIKQMKGVGASGSFRLVKGDVEAKPKKPAAKAKKPAAKKPAKKAEKKTPKKKAAKKPTAANKTPTKKPKAAKRSPAKKSSTKKTSKPKKPVVKKAKK